MGYGGSNPISLTLMNQLRCLVLLKALVCLVNDRIRENEPPLEPHLKHGYIRGPPKVAPFQHLGISSGLEGPDLLS